MKSRKILAILLALVLVLPLFGGAFASAENNDGQYLEQYDTVFMHGLFGWGYGSTVNEVVPYWGMFSGDMIEYLNESGSNVYSVDVGTVSSAWDRCCDLFAQLTGTRVDYGAAHAAKVNAESASLGYTDLVHARYGRDYNGNSIVQNWGPIYDANGKVTGFYDNKLNIVGHSFGGPTAVEFLNLLAEGDADEIAWGKAQAEAYGGDWHDYVSPLFWGDYDGENLINSITSLAGVLNGTTFISTCDISTEVVTSLVLGLGNALGVTDISDFYDFHLEQFGITKVKGQDFSAQFSYIQRKGFLAQSDNAIYDLSIEGCNQLKQGWKVYDNVYYFAYAGNATTKTALGNYLPNADMWPLLMAFSTDMGQYTNADEVVLDVNGAQAAVIDTEWLPNDGMVNTISARYPLGLPSKPLDSSNIESGIWQWADKAYDHMAFCGGMYIPRTAEMQEFYGELMYNIFNAGGRVVADESPFADVKPGDYFYDSVLWAYNAKPQIACGTDDGLFLPYTYCTRAQVVTFLWRAFGCPEALGDCPFTDVAKSAYYYDAVCWAYENGIVAGMTADTFAPDATVTRAQFVTFLWRSVGSPAPESKISLFFDVIDKNAYFYNAVLWAAEQGITVGRDFHLFAPYDPCTRGNVITFLYRAGDLLTPVENQAGGNAIYG